MRVNVPAKRLIPLAPALPTFGDERGHWSPSSARHRQDADRAGSNGISLSGDTLGIYATLGVFLIIASRDPMAHRALSGSRSGRVSCMVRSWRFSRSPILSTLGIFGEMFWP